jgi:hypothetical protein
MNENENNFESLRRLLALKRYETPPPGYFHSFSDQVRKRICAGDPGTSAGWWEDLLGQAPWTEKLLQLFDVKPVFAGAFAGALCLLLLVGIIYAERPDMASQTDLSPVATAATANPATFASVSPTTLSQPAEQGGIVSSTTPVLSLQPVASPFDQQTPLVQPVGFTVPAK